MSWHRPNSTAGKITSPFGPRGPISGAPDASRDHLGVDLRAGTLGVTSDIYAATAGTVRRIYKTPLNAWVLELDHGRGVMTRYAHMQRAGIAVKVGAKVSSGQRVASASNSGAPTIHLHFEVLVAGRQVDPVPYLQARGIDLTTTTTSNAIAGTGSLPAPTASTPPAALNPLPIDIQEDEMFRIQVTESPNPKSGEIGRVYLVRFGPKGEALFVHIAPTENAIHEKTKVPLYKVSHFEKDTIRQAVITRAANWKVS